MFINGEKSTENYIFGFILLFSLQYFVTLARLVTLSRVFALSASCLLLLLELLNIFGR